MPELKQIKTWYQKGAWFRWNSSTCNSAQNLLRRTNVLYKSITQPPLQNKSSKIPFVNPFASLKLGILGLLLFHEGGRINNTCKILFLVPFAFEANNYLNHFDSNITRINRDRLFCLKTIYDIIRCFKRIDIVGEISIKFLSTSMFDLIFFRP